VPTIKEVAALAGVSPTTVSYVLLDRKPVLPSTKERVMAAAQRLGYTPHGPAQALRTGRSRTIGLCVSVATNPTMGAIIQGASQRAYESGYVLSVAISARNPALERAHLQVLTRQRVAALILTPPAGEATPYAELQRAGIPVICVDSRPAGLEADLVAADHYQGTLAATSHLLASGRRRVALLTIPTSLGSSAARLAGYREAHARAGLPVPEELVRAELVSREAARAAVAELLAATQPPDAIIAGGPPLTLGALACLREKGIAIPDAVALVGSGDVSWAPLVEPALSLVEVDGEALGRKAVEVALARAETGLSGAPACDVFMPVALVVRASSAARPT
jgi:LacI family transcriptional regulator